MKTLRIINAGAKTIGFRSLNELRQMMDQISKDLVDIDAKLETVQISSVTVEIDAKPKRVSKNNKKVELVDAPTTQELTQHFSILVELDEKLRLLDSMLAQLDYSFKNERDHQATVRELKSLRKNLESKIKASYAFINKVAKGTVDKDFKAFCSEVTAELLEVLEGQYDSSTQRLFVDIIDHTVRYTHYLKLTNFEDDSGYTYKEYYICLTHLLDPGNARYLANTIASFRAPGRFNPGVEVDDAEIAIDTIGNMLISEGFKNVLHGHDLPITDSDVDQARFSDYAKSVKVDGAELVVTLNAGIKGEDVITNLFVIVQGLLDQKVAKGQQIKYKIERSKIRFFLNHQQPLKLNRGQLKMMQTTLVFLMMTLRKLCK